MLDVKNEIDYPLEAEELQEFTMTALGKLIFVDIHSRRARLLTSNKSSKSFVDSLSLAFENLFHMPFDIMEEYSADIHTLDISHNKFSRNLQFLSEFDNLTSLNLDHNNIDNYTVLPYMPKLELLWLNYNGIEDLYPFIKNLCHSVPNLRYLCLMGNKAAPSYLNGGTFYDYLQYRLFVISWFPHLAHLDDRIVTLEQQQEAKRLFKRPLFENFIEHAPLPICMKHLHNSITKIVCRSSLLDKPKKMPKSRNVVV